MTVDDGGRLWINGQQVIDAWQTQASQSYTANAQLPGNPVRVRMEYFENTGNALARLSWNKITAPPPDDTPGWREAIPARWHPVFQRCLNFFQDIGLELGPDPNWDALLEQCRESTRP